MQIKETFTNTNLYVLYLSDALVGSFHAGPDALGRFVGELDGHLQTHQLKIEKY